MIMVKYVRHGGQEMSEEERRALLAKMEASSEEAKSLTQEQARKRLSQEGYIDAKGELRPEYGGPAKS